MLTHANMLNLHRWRDSSSMLWCWLHTQQPPGAHMWEDCLKCSQSAGIPLSSDPPHFGLDRTWSSRSLRRYTPTTQTSFPALCPPFMSHHRERPVCPPCGTQLGTAHSRAGHSRLITVTGPRVSGPLQADKPMRSSPESNHFLEVCWSLFPLWPPFLPEFQSTPLFSQNGQAE